MHQYILPLQIFYSVLCSIKLVQH